LASFLAVIFLLMGLYLLGDAFQHPLDAQAAGILTAALSLALSAILFYFLLKPRRGVRPRTSRFRRVG